jgi:hypothetical protein
MDLDLIIDKQEVVFIFNDFNFELGARYKSKSRSRSHERFQSSDKEREIIN